jgi:hypothetical protein
MAIGNGLTPLGGVNHRLGSFFGQSKGKRLRIMKWHFKDVRQKSRLCGRCLYMEILRVQANSRKFGKDSMLKN